MKCLILSLILIVVPSNALRGEEMGCSGEDFEQHVVSSL
jgi:hypothetical protein